MPANPFPSPYIPSGLSQTSWRPVVPEGTMPTPPYSAFHNAFTGPNYNLPTSRQASAPLSNWPVNQRPAGSWGGPIGFNATNLSNPNDPNAAWMRSQPTGARA